jgi:hypothetical protein
MSSVVIAGDTSGSVTLQAPAVAGTTTLTLPATSGTVLTTASSGQSIPKAALPTGSVLQVVMGTTSTQVTSSSASFVDTGISATITPSSTSSKILVIYNVAGIFMSAVANAYITMSMVRNGTQVYSPQYALGYLNSALVRSTSAAGEYLDSPASTSALTYKIQSATVNAITVDYQRDNAVTSTMILMEIAG